MFNTSVFSVVLCCQAAFQFEWITSNILSLIQTVFEIFSLILSISVWVEAREKWKEIIKNIAMHVWPWHCDMCLYICKHFALQRKHATIAARYTYSITCMYLYQSEMYSYKLCSAGRMVQYTCDNIENRIKKKCIAQLTLTAATMMALFKKINEFYSHVFNANVVLNPLSWFTIAYIRVSVHKEWINQTVFIWIHCEHWDVSKNSLDRYILGNYHFKKEFRHVSKRWSIGSQLLWFLKLNFTNNFKRPLFFNSKVNFGRFYSSTFHVFHIGNNTII